MRDHVRFLVRLIIFGIVFTILCKSGIWVFAFILTYLV